VSKKKAKFNQKKKNAQKILKRFKKPDGTRKETNIERQMKKILESLSKHGLKYKQEAPIKYGKCSKFFDFLIWIEDGNGFPLKAFFIEAHGDFYHAKEYYEGKKTKSELCYVQKKNLNNDKRKYLLAKKNQMEIIYFWESDIMSKGNWVKDKIRKILLTQEIIYETKIDDYFDLLKNSMKSMGSTKRRESLSLPLDIEYPQVISDQLIEKISRDFVLCSPLLS
jgi:G:T-mismatch repair DNA endonuclease (very short patch repair protein)